MYKTEYSYKPVHLDSDLKTFQQAFTKSSQV